MVVFLVLFYLGNARVKALRLFQVGVPKQRHLFYFAGEYAFAVCGLLAGATPPPPPQLIVRTLRDARLRLLADMRGDRQL